MGSDPDEQAVTGAHADPAIAAFARFWLDGIGRSHYIVRRGGRARMLLERLTGTLASLVTAESLDAPAARAIGADLFTANVSDPDALSRSIDLVRERLLPWLGITDPRAPARLAQVLAQVNAGFIDTLREQAQRAGEDISRAEREAWREKQQRLQARLNHVLSHDPLTDLPNWEHLVQRLREAIDGAAAGRRLGVCVLKLQRFEQLEHSLGTRKGDQLLLAVARALRGLAAADGYFLAHLGRDEFVFVVEGTATEDDVAKVADLALRTLPDACRIDDHEIPVSGKAGIVEHPAAGADPTELLRRARMALGWAMTERHSHIAPFDPWRNTEDVLRHELSDDMPRARERGEFTLVYQPLVRLRDGHVVGMEALARWTHPVHGRIPPNRFIPLAVDTGLIMPLGQDFLEQACRQAARWGRLAPHPPLVSVNLAVAQLQQPGLAALVEATLDRTGLDPRHLQLEITEDDLIHPHDGIVATLHALADLGVRLVLDDCGTGHSSLAMLGTLPIHGVKLAAGFLTGIEPGTTTLHSNARMLPTLIRMAHDLNLDITAEGIDEAHQVDRLAALGCDTGQGYHLGRPLPPHETARLLAGYRGRSAAHHSTDVVRPR
ncbi:MAG TPA: bifunctional diguanylate cyclase/phosphodiesterase [Rugosimonospora sp.]